MTTILNPTIKHGYMGVYSTSEVDKSWIVKDPTGKRTFFVTNLNKFCASQNKRRKNKLDSSHLAKVGRGERNHHRGWTATQVV